MENIWIMYTREEMKVLKRDFWSGFDEFCAQLPRFKYRKKKWILYNTKIKGVEMKFDANREGAFVIMEFNHPRETKRKKMMETMAKFRSIVDKHFPDSVWEDSYQKPCGKFVSRIYKQKPGIDLHRRSDWPEFYPFLSKEMSFLEKVFRDLRDFLEEDANASTDEM